MNDLLSLYTLQHWINPIARDKSQNREKVLADENKTVALI